MNDYYDLPWWGKLRVRLLYWVMSLFEKEPLDTPPWKDTET